MYAVRSERMLQSMHMRVMQLYSYESIGNCYLATRQTSASLNEKRRTRFLLARFLPVSLSDEGESGCFLMQSMHTHLLANLQDQSGP